MIQQVKEALLEDLQSKAGSGGWCEGVKAWTDSEVEPQPTGNSPLFQVKFAVETSPTGLQGYGSPTTFEEVFELLCLLKTTAPEPEASRSLYNLWWRRATDGNLTGVKIALHQLLATGLAVGSDRWVLRMGSVKPRRLDGVYAACLEIPLMLLRAFDG